MSDSVVLDASTVLAFLHKEQGEELVAHYLEHGKTAISIVNVAEILTKQQDVGIPAIETLSFIELLGIRIFDFDQEAALKVAGLRNQTKAFGLSLGDRACLALAEKLACPVLTADRVWSQLNLDVKIIQIR